MVVSWPNEWIGLNLLAQLLHANAQGTGEPLMCGGIPGMFRQKETRREKHGLWGHPAQVSRLESVHLLSQFPCWKQTSVGGHENEQDHRRQGLSQSTVPGAWCLMDRCNSHVKISVGESTWRGGDPFGDPETLDLSSSEGARCPRVVKTKSFWEQGCL